MRPFSMALPKSLAEAVAAVGARSGRHRFYAGGCDLLALLKEGVVGAERLVNLKRIPGLDAIERRPEGLVLGALATLARIERHPEVAHGWPALVEAIRMAATPQVRNAATIAGNLCQRPRCWYFRDATYPCLKKGGARCYAREGENEYHSIFENDLCAAVHPSNSAPVLVAYGALLEVVGPSGSRRIPVEDFFTSPATDVARENVLRPDEAIQAVILPRESEGRPAAYVETREKQSFDWPLCSSTVVLALDGDKVREARIVLGAVAPRPLRRADLEQKLVGRKLDQASIAGVAALAGEGATPLAQNGYKIALARVTLGRALAEAAERSRR